jgi:hypothetical protein
MELKSTVKAINLKDIKALYNFEWRKLMISGGLL